MVEYLPKSARALPVQIPGNAPHDFVEAVHRLYWAEEETLHTFGRASPLETAATDNDQQKRPPSLFETKFVEPLLALAETKEIIDAVSIFSNTTTTSVEFWETLLSKTIMVRNNSFLLDPRTPTQKLEILKRLRNQALKTAELIASEVFRQVEPCSSDDRENDQAEPLLANLHIPRKTHSFTNWPDFELPENIDIDEYDTAPDSINFTLLKSSAWVGEIAHLNYNLAATLEHITRSMQDDEHVSKVGIPKLRSLVDHLDDVFDQHYPQVSQNRKYAA